MALAFLMLYLFISLPVQFWHHHSDEKQATSAVKVSKLPGNSLQGENCKICQHIYSPYIDEHPVYSIEAITGSITKKGYAFTSYPDVFIFELSNKSPPAV